VVFNANGGAWSETDTLSDGYELNSERTTATIQATLYGSVTPVTPEPTLKGYRFTGWYYNGTKVANRIQLTSVDLFDASGTLTLTAGWEAVSEELSYTINQYYIDRDVTSPILHATSTSTATKGTAISALVSGMTQDQGSYLYRSAAAKVNGSALVATSTLTTNGTVIDLYYYLDQWNAIDGNLTGGDGTPDCQQAVVQFNHDPNGTLDGDTVQFFTLTELNSEGIYTGEQTPTTVTPKANDNFTFDMWTKGENDTSVDPFVPQTLTGGQQVIYYAHFAQDTKGGTDNNGNEIGDGIPDKYQVFVKYDGGANGKLSDKASDPSQAFDLRQTGTTELKTSVTLDFPETTPDTGYKFKAWTAPSGVTLDGNVLSGFTAGKTYTITAIWDRTVTTVEPEVAAYQVEHYKENADGSYTLAETDFPLYGELTKEVTAVAKTYEGYALNTQNSNTVQSGVVVIPTVTDGKANMLTLKLYYDIDKIGGSTSGTGDGIPDKYQVVVTYQSNNTSYGSVSKTTEVVTLKDADNNNATTGTVTASATASTASLSRVYFSNWTYNNSQVGTAATLSYTIANAKGGETYAFTANFGRSSGGGGGSSSSSTRPSTDIQDPDVPLAGDPALNTEDHFAYIKGYSDGTIRPTNYITRAQVATIFYRLLDDNTRAIYFSDSNDFSDVADDYWANKAISTLTNAGIITGFQDGTFRPNAYITRAQFAAISARFSVVTEDLPMPFTDVPEDYWAADLIAYAAHIGWIDGYADGTFRPTNNITRAAAMKLINNVLGRQVDADGLLPDATQWTDVDVDDWCYYIVLEATNSHDYDRRSTDSQVENWTALTADRIWDE
jgi:uncharacterized repeat protein (TIGR02543 family)